MIDKSMTIYEVMQLNPEAADVLTGFGMHCLHCPTARGESLEQAARVHGIDIDEMVDKLNELFEQA